MRSRAVVEFIYVIAGGLTVHIGEQDHALAAGDSIYFDSSQAHAYRRTGARPCTAIVVTSA